MRAMVAAANQRFGLNTVCLVGLGDELTFALARNLRRKLTILTSWTMSLQGQKACADFIERDVDIDPIFTNRRTLEQADMAYQKLHSQDGGKACSSSDEYGAQIVRE
jgi:threonine dehydrogenase-like Zn-dependent dehydrogenase